MPLKTLLFFLTISLSSTAQAADLATRLHDAVAGKIDRPFMGIFLVAQGDKIIYEKVHGNFAKHPISSQFIMGSISKQFTVTIILKLVDQKLIDLDKPIKVYLPDLRNDWATIVTVRHLLNHTSGIKDLNSPLEFTPGSQMKYVRLDPYSLAGQIAVAVSGKDYDSLINELFALSSMTQSGLAFSSDMNTNRRKYPLLPRGFRQKNNGRITEVTIITPFDLVYKPCAGVISSAHDLLKWHRSLHTGKLLSSHSYQQMITSYGLIRHHAYGHVGYGLGLQLLKADGIEEISHHGYSAGYVSSIFYYPKSEISIIALENVTHSWTMDKKRIYHNHDAIRDVVRSHIKQTAAY